VSDEGWNECGERREERREEESRRKEKRGEKREFWTRVNES
jgi:hypothetical protein